MKNQHVTPRKALNKAFLKIKPNRDDIERFKSQFIQLLDHINEKESEEFLKNLVSDFFKRTYYEPTHFINTKGRSDLVIHTEDKASSPVGIIIEAKKPSNKAEMLKVFAPEDTKEQMLSKLNVKALHELLLYFLRERISHNNLQIKHLIVTNIYEWFVFDAALFEKWFVQDKKLLKLFNDFEKGTLTDTKTDFFYKQIAEPFIANMQDEITYVHFDIRDYEKILRNDDKQDDKALIALFKLLSPEHLLKLPFANDSNSLDKRFYDELLHLIGLTETKEGSKKIITRAPEDKRNAGSLLENALLQLDSLEKIPRFQSNGTSYDERLFSVGLELSITWVNRILFLKLLEAQLFTYNKKDLSYTFLNTDRIKDYDDLNALFFQVLAKLPEERNATVKSLFDKVPYLNSSLFEPTELEKQMLFINQLKDNITLPIHPSTVLKDEVGKKKTGTLNPLTYFFAFLDAYDFTNVGSEDIQEENKTLINASVLGLIFEKINGYKDGSFFTPGFITMYMSRETLRKATVQKFNEVKGWQIDTFDDLYDKIEDRNEANQIINSIKIVDPAVGSGHFLVSALNEMIAIKNDLRILQDREGKRLKEYQCEVVNDELIITDEDGNLLNYNPHHKESQRIQVALFHEKQTLIENCLFGVDINPNSVKICRLRLWIELLKHAYYKDGTQLETLPNIDINIKTGNSLISRFALDADLSKALKESKWNIDAYKIAVDTYRNAKNKEQKHQMEQLIQEIKTNFRSEIALNDPKMKRLRTLNGELFQLTQQTQLFERTEKEKKKWDEQVKKLTADIKKLDTEIEDIKANKIYENAFEWRFEFPEVLDHEGNFVGFDVVMGNPPYMIIFDENIKPFLERNYPEFKRNNDLYVSFIKLGFSVLKEKGVFSFITPNTFIRGDYFIPIRNFLSKETQIIEIIDFGNILIFEGVNVFCAITTSEKRIPNKKWILKSNLELKEGFIEPFNSDFILKNEIIKKLDKFDKFDKYFLIKDVGFNYWSEGRGKLRGGSIGSKVFYNGKKENVNDIPFIKGVDIQKYSLSFSNNFLRNNWRNLLNENDTFRFSNEIMEMVPKLIYRQTSNRIIASIDFNKNFNDKTVHIIVNNDNNQIDLKVVLAILNSKLLNYFFQSFKNEDGRAFAQVKTIDIKNLPFVIPGENENLIFGILVDKILIQKQADPTADTSALEQEIDQMVYELYGLTEEEIAVVEGS